MATEVQCPQCGEKLDARVTVDGSHKDPSVGDVSVCYYCSAVNVFGAESLEVPDVETLDTLLRDRDIQRALAVLNTRRNRQL